MRLAFVILVLSVIIWPMAAHSQNAQIYDNSYSGPRNYQGLPKYEPIVRPQAPKLQNPYLPSQGQYGSQQQRAVPQNPYGNLYNQGLNQPAQQYGNTPFHRLYRSAASLGGYFWQYMPAPVRGEQNSFIPAPGSGNVVITNVGPAPR